jgi:hypothetical protein
MPTLRERVDVESVAVTRLPLPKGKTRGSGVGFCGGLPTASVEGVGYAAPPFRWLDGKARAVTFHDVKKIGANGTSESQLAGFWTTPKGDERALVWTENGPDLVGVELHPSNWQKSVGMACGDGQQVGYGSQDFSKDPTRALLWSGSPESMVVLTAPDPELEAMAHGVAGGVQVGCVGSAGRPHACLWRGTTDSFLDLHPEAPGIVGTEAWGIGDGQQVGAAWDDEMRQMAALWSGSPGSFVSLAPQGFVRSRASRCARGFQAGWVGTEGRGMLLRAALWNGAADDYLDLQAFLGDPWNASWAQDILVDGDRLVVLGTAQQVVRNNRWEMDGGKIPVMWEMRLRIAEPARRTVVAPAARPAARQEAQTPLSPEQRVDRTAADFAQAVVDGDYKTAHGHLAPWLRRLVTPRKLQSIIKKEFIDGTAPADFTTSGNDTTLDDLRAHYREYHKDDAARTLATAKSFGEWGPPSIHIADDVTAANYRQWMSIEFAPDPDSGSELDYCLRLWVIVVEVDGAMVIGHLEPGE